MPVSKKRKKPSQKPSRKPPASTAIPKRNPMQPRETEEQLAARIRAQFVDLAQTEGHLFLPEATYLASGPPVECWTNAWLHAETNGLDYAEGVALMPNGWHAHAWCVTADGTVVEPTRGYDHATEYRGWILNAEGRHAINVLHDGDARTSFIESGLGSGAATWEQIKERFLSDPPASS